MIYSVNNNTAYNYSKYIARPKWLVNIFKQADAPRTGQPSLSRMSQQVQSNPNMCAFECKELLCYRSDLEFFNLRGYFSNMLKAVHMCWIAARNNKRVLFICGNDHSDQAEAIIMHLNLLKQYVRQTVPAISFYKNAKQTSTALSNTQQNKAGSKPHLNVAKLQSGTKRKPDQVTTPAKPWAAKKKTAEHIFDRLVSFLKLTSTAVATGAGRCNSSSSNGTDQKSALQSRVASHTAAIAKTSNTENRGNMLEKPQARPLRLEQHVQLNALAIHAAARHTAYSVVPTCALICNTKAGFKTIYNLLHVFNEQSFALSQIAAFETPFQAQDDRKQLTGQHFLNGSVPATGSGDRSTKHSSKSKAQRVNSEPVMHHSSALTDAMMQQSTCNSKLLQQVRPAVGAAKRNTNKPFWGKLVQSFFGPKKHASHKAFVCRLGLSISGDLFTMQSQALQLYNLHLNTPVNKTFTGGLLEQQQPIQALLAHAQYGKNKSLRSTPRTVFKPSVTSFWAHKTPFINQNRRDRSIENNAKHVAVPTTQHFGASSFWRKLVTKKQRFCLQYGHGRHKTKSLAWLKSLYVQRFYKTASATTDKTKPGKKQRAFAVPLSAIGATKRNNAPHAAGLVNFKPNKKNGPKTNVSVAWHHAQKALFGAKKHASHVGFGTKKKRLRSRFKPITLKTKSLCCAHTL